MESRMAMGIIWNGNGNYLSNGNDIEMEMEIISALVIRIKWKLQGFKCKQNAWTQKLFSKWKYHWKPGWLNKTPRLRDRRRVFNYLRGTTWRGGLCV